MVWVSPKTWIAGENLTSANFNEQLQQNMLYLLNKNIRTVEIRNGISDPTTSTTTWMPVDPLVQYVDIQTYGGDVMIKANISHYRSLALGYNLFDVLITDSKQIKFYLSSLTNTPLTDGLWREQLGSSYVRKRSYSTLWENVPAGEY